MKFALNDEQHALNDAVHDFVTKNVSSDSVRTAMVSEFGYDEDLYASMCAELGLTSLIIPDEYGGFGASDVELAVVMNQIGYVLAPTPLRTHISAQIAVLECATEQNKSDHLGRSVSGEESATVLYADEVARDFGHELPRDNGAGAVVLSGEFSRVPYGLSAQHLYFFIGENASAQLVHIDLTSDGVSRSMVPSLDQTIPLATVSLTGALGRVISDEGTSSNYARARARAIIAASNEIVGSTQATLDMSVAYAKDRVQFGRPIGSFQAIKHKCAEMLLETESSRSIALYGAWLASQDGDLESRDLESNLDHIASMSKYYCSKAFSHAAGENIQIHGGIGFTFEHDAQLYFKRAAFMNAYLGLPHEHARNIASELRRRIHSV